MILRTLCLVLLSSGLVNATTHADSSLVERPPAERATSILGQHTRLVLSSKDLLQSMAWWDDQAIVVGVCHHERAHQTC